MILRSYTDLITLIQRRKQETETRIIGSAIGFSVLGCLALSAISSGTFAPAAPIYGAVAGLSALMFVFESFRVRGIERDLALIQFAQRNNLPPDRADTECQRAVAAALAEGQDVPAALAEAA